MLGVQASFGNQCYIVDSLVHPAVVCTVHYSLCPVHAVEYRRDVVLDVVQACTLGPLQAHALHDLASVSVKCVSITTRTHTAVQMAPHTTTASLLLTSTAHHHTLVNYTNILYWNAYSHFF